MYDKWGNDIERLLYFIRETETDRQTDRQTERKREKERMNE